jgi:hypothetical protein
VGAVRAFTAPTTAAGLLAAALVLFAAGQVWTGAFQLFAWTLLGVTAGFSLSGSV